MSTTPTTNLNLIKNNADEPIANWRTNDNTNMNALDTAIKAVQDATDTLEKARQNLNNLIGVLGKNSSNADLISKAQARANLDVAQSGGAAKTLYADEQTIAQNASLIASLQDSVSRWSLNGQVTDFTVWSVGSQLTLGILLNGATNASGTMFVVAFNEDNITFFKRVDGVDTPLWVK